MSTNYSVTYKADDYLKNYYRSNKSARKTADRGGKKNSELSVADAAALKRAVRNLRETDFDTIDSEEIKKSVAAFVETYNNALKTADGSSSVNVNRRMKQIKNLFSENEQTFASLGISMSKTGELSIAESTFSTKDASDFKKVFSKDSDFTNKLDIMSQKLYLMSTRHQKSEAIMKKKAEDTSSDVTSPITTALNKSSSFIDLYL